MDRLTEFYSFCLRISRLKMNSQLELLQTLRTAVFNQLITSNPDLNIAILLLDTAFLYRFLLSNSKEAREAKDSPSQSTTDLTGIESTRKALIKHLEWRRVEAIQTLGTNQLMEAAVPLSLGVSSI